MVVEHPSYYAVIPAEVRYDPDLSASAKLFYGEITALANKTGDCWASNRYFTDLFGVSDQSIRNWLKELEQKGYVSVWYEMDGKETKARHVSIAEGVKNSLGGGKEFLLPTPKKNLGHNNTRIDNNTRIIKDIVEYLNQRTGKKYRFGSSSTQLKIKARLNEGYTEEDFRKVIDIKTDEWKGTDMEQYLRPETLFGNKFESYLNQTPKKGKEGHKWGTVL